MYVGNQVKCPLCCLILPGMPVPPDRHTRQ